jgi:4-hydroxybenzoate polyprenyltransferase
MTALLLLKSLRPRQWIKNGFILIPLLFAQKFFDYPQLLKILQAAAIFCAATGAVYLINDSLDREEDRLHPIKRNRPLAAGLISLPLAVVTAAVLLLLSLLWGIWLQKDFFFVLLAYLSIQFLYNLALKDLVILDVFSVSAGFFLRVTAGAVTIDVPMSRWLIICTILLAIFLSLCKRRHELTTLGKAEAGAHRKVLAQYSAYLLDQMIGVTTAGVLLSYLLYCTSPETVKKFQTDHLIYTFSFVLYGIFRYLYLMHRKKEGGSPERILLSDFPLLCSVFLWGLLSLIITQGVL